MVERDYCYGCTACYNICPTHCITMVEDSEGFLYPYVNEDKCIKCGKCEEYCPALHIRGIFDKRPFTWGGYTRNSDIRRKSSSGGIFSELAEQIIADNGVVFGAAFNEKKDSVQHIAIDAIADINKIRGSKYVQSDLSNCFSEVLKILKEGRKVLFSGTFCQIDGLRMFLKDDYPNLITVEMICHGVPSPKLLKKYVDEKRKKLGGDIKSFSFRDEVGGPILYINIESENRKYRRSSQTDSYYSLFFSNNCLRPACYNCRSKGKQRVADFTLADFWGVENVASDLIDGGGISLVIVNTNKGMELFEKIKEKISGREVDFYDAIKGNVAFFTPYKKPNTREQFWRDFQNKTTSQLRWKYCRVIRKSIKRFLKSFT